MKRISVVLALLLMAVIGISTGRAQPEPVRYLLIDDDIGMLRDEVKKVGAYQAPWVPVTDPDGGVELLYALKDPRVKVLGITCSMGCSTTDVCMDSAEKLLELTGRTDVPVLRGANSPEDLGRPTDAALFIVSTVMSHPGEVEIIATAPLTNIATALMLEPCLPMNWKALHFGTGEFMGELGERSDAYYARYTGYKDLNLNVDPRAAAYVLDHGGHFPIYPNEFMDDAWFTREDLRAIKSAGTPLSQFTARELKPFFNLMSLYNSLHGVPGLYLHGVIPLATALDPQLAEPPRRLRVTMTERRFGGHTFTITGDPAVPLRDVYVKLQDRRTVEERAMAACQ